MKGFFYAMLIRCSRLGGAWLFKLSARFIAGGYFFFGGRVSESRRFYAALYPHRGRWHHLGCSFRQYQNFTTIHYDRFLSHREEPRCTAEGWERLEEVIGGQGGILLMSHLGNWEMAAALLKKQRSDLRLLLYMGVKEKEGVERMQKEGLRQAGVTIIGEEKDQASPFSALEGIRFLESGGLVSMTGDMLWRDDQRRVRISFLGHAAYVAQAPFVFSLVSKAPLFAFFAFRTGENSYHLTLSQPIEVDASSRAERDQAIARAAQRYGELLEDALRNHPLEWYHFDRFLHEPLDQRQDRED